MQNGSMVCTTLYFKEVSDSHLKINMVDTRKQPYALKFLIKSNEKLWSVLGIEKCVWRCLYKKIYVLVMAY